MAEILFVDWDGLIYYDGKIKDYIEDKIKECLKFRGNVSYEELLQTSPSVDTVNTAFRLSEEFVTNEWFNKPGFSYPEGTIVYVAQFEDGAYKFDILVASNGSSGGTDLTNYYNKEEVDNIVSELPTKEFVEKTIIDAIDSVEIDVSGLVTKEELEEVQNVVGSNSVKLLQLDSDLVDINQRLDSIETPDLSNYYNKTETETLITEAVESIEHPTVDLNGYATEEWVNKQGFLTEHQSLEGYAKLTDIPDVTNLVSRETLNIELDKKANDILFTDNYVVTTPLGGFSADESVQNITITQIITKLLGLVTYTPPVVPGSPENVPEETPEELKLLIASETPVYVVDGSGNLVKAEYDTYYKQMTTTESWENSKGNHFYQIVNDETGGLEESGYQVDTVYDDNLYMTVALPRIITNFHLEAYNSKAQGDDKWQKVTYTLKPVSEQTIDGYIIYSAEETETDGGATIRIVIDS